MTPLLTQPTHTHSRKQASKFKCVWLSSLTSFSWSPAKTRARHKLQATNKLQVRALHCIVALHCNANGRRTNRRSMRRKHESTGSATTTDRDHRHELTNYCTYLQFQVRSAARCLDFDVGVPWMARLARRELGEDDCRHG